MVLDYLFVCFLNNTLLYTLKDNGRFFAYSYIFWSNLKFVIVIVLVFTQFYPNTWLNGTIVFGIEKIVLLRGTVQIHKGFVSGNWLRLIRCNSQNTRMRNETTNDDPDTLKRVENPMHRVPSYDHSRRTPHGTRKNSSAKVDRNRCRNVCSCKHKKPSWSTTNDLTDRSASAGWYERIAHSYDRPGAADEIFGHGHGHGHL